MTQPTDGESLKTCVTDLGSINLSWVTLKMAVEKTFGHYTNRHFLLRNHDGAILPPNPYRGNVGRGDGFEGIFCLELFSLYS